MAHQLVELDGGQNRTVLVAVDVPEELVQRTSAGNGAIDRIDRSFSEVKQLIVQCCEPLTDAFEQLNQSTNARHAEAEFGISFTLKGSVYLVECSSQASLKVKVMWDFDTNTQSGVAA